MRTPFISALLLVSVLNLTACGGAETAPAPETVAPTAESTTKPETAPTAESTAKPETVATEGTPDHSAATKGGQVVETGAYHFELVPVPEADGIHLDLYLQTGNTHEAVADATVVAQVQFPDGTQQEVPMKYDAAGEHFFAFFPSQATGEYKVVVQSDIKGEKVNTRFSFAK